MKRRGSVLAMSTLLLVVACAPDPVPPAPRWVTTHVSRTTTTTSTTNYVGAWTDEDWASTLEVTTITGGGSAKLHFFPRSGPGNSVLDTPQSVTPSIAVNLSGPMGEHIVALGGSSQVEFFRETAGTWGSAGTFTLPPDTQLAAANDHWMALRTFTLSPGVETSVRVYALDSSGPTVVATPAATLLGDPAWPLALREGFGGPGVALDGDIIVVGAHGQFGPTPGGARIFRATSGTWAPVLSLGASTSGPNIFATALAVHDGPTVDRVVIGPQGDSPTLPQVFVYADAGSGFALEQTLSRDTSDPDASSGGLFGAAVAIEGDLIAVTSRTASIPSAEVGHANVTVGYVQLFRKGATWAEETEVATHETPAPADVVSMLPFKLQITGNHVAVTMFISPDPPPGCTFPCFNFGFEAWSIDRTA